MYENSDLPEPQEAPGGKQLRERACLPYPDAAVRAGGIAWVRETPPHARPALYSADFLFERLRDAPSPPPFSMPRLRMRGLGAATPPPPPLRGSSTPAGLRKPELLADGGGNDGGGSGTARAPRRSDPTRASSRKSCATDVVPTCDLDFLGCLSLADAANGVLAPEMDFRRLSGAALLVGDASAVAAGTSSAFGAGVCCGVGLCMSVQRAT